MPICHGEVGEPEGTMTCRPWASWELHAQRRPSRTAPTRTVRSDDLANRSVGVPVTFTVTSTSTDAIFDNGFEST